MAGPRIFIDTNILFYAHDFDAKEKHEKAKSLVIEYWQMTEMPFISIQVLQELYVNFIRKGIPLNEAQDITKDYSAWNLVNNDKKLLFLGMEYHNRFKTSWWDALILAAAYQAKATILLSEDFTHNMKFGKMQIKNPLL